MPSDVNVFVFQFENNYIKRSCSPGSPSTFMEESQQYRQTFGLCNSTKSFNGSLDLEPSTERSRTFANEVPISFDKRDAQDLRNVCIELRNKNLTACYNRERLTFLNYLAGNRGKGKRIEKAGRS